jgi:hypothetical protein
LCCCHWMFSGCNSRKGKRKCLHCMLQRSSHVAEVINVMVLHNNNRSYSGKNDVSWHCSSNSCTKGEGAIVGQSTITAIAICDWSFPNLLGSRKVCQVWEVQKVQRRFKIGELEGLGFRVQFGPSFLFFNIIYQTYKLSLGPIQTCHGFLGHFQFFFIYISYFLFFQIFWSWGLGWDRFGTNPNLPCVYYEKVLK